MKEQTGDRNETNPYESPPIQEVENKPWNLDVNESLPLQVAVTFSATLYRRFKLTGWVNAELVWDGMHSLVICNGREFLFARKYFQSSANTSIEFGAKDAPHVLSIESRILWFYFTHAIRISIDGTVIYSEGIP